MSHSVSAARSSRYLFMAVVGDSGSWVLNAIGRVLGMIWVAAVEDSASTIVAHPLETAGILPSRECLDVFGKSIDEDL